MVSDEALQVTYWVQFCMIVCGVGIILLVYSYSRHTNEHRANLSSGLVHLTLGVSYSAKIVRFVGPKPWMTFDHKQTARNDMENIGQYYDILAQVWINIYFEDIHPKISQFPNLELATLNDGNNNNCENKQNVASRIISKDNCDYLQDSIAVVGMSCRYPGANSVEEFWELLIGGKDAIQVVPAERWNDIETNEEDGDCRKTAAGFLKCAVDEFDSKFFGISPREAAFMDPQQRLLLEVAWEGFESAGINPQNLSGSNTGVFIGVWTQDYERMLRNNVQSSEVHRIYLGNAHSAISARISFCLGLNGPNIATESGCSSSFVSLHLACESLKKGECDIALSGGVNLLLHPFPLDGPGKPYFLAPDGHCKTFDATANGFGRAEGCGVVVLKRLGDAQRDGDRVLGIVRGSAVSSEGTTASFGTPSKLCQEIVIKDALRNSNIAPSSVSYIEAHGTGTIIGDPIEVAAIASAYSGRRKQPLVIGSVKTNIGHSEGAAGIAGLLKVILSLQHEMIPPHRNFGSVNPSIKLEEIPATIPLEATKWPKTCNESRIAGISSFGISGTNVHVLVEEPPTHIKTALGELKFQRPQHILTISAKTENALIELVIKYQNYLKSNPQACIADVAYTANTGRAHLNHRIAVIGTSAADILTNLEKKKYVSGKSTCQTPMVAFLFTGQGSQYTGMAKDLYKSHPVFKKSMDKCARLLQHNLGISLFDVLWNVQDQENLPNNGKNEQNLTKLDQTMYSQTSIFCIEFSLLQLWKSFGVNPDFVLGHSVGEFAAATAAGIMSLEDALKLVSQRGRLIQNLPPGGMLAVKTSPKTVLHLIDTFTAINNDLWIDIAVINSIEEVVVAGKPKALELFTEFCAQEGVKTVRVAATHAFHSREMGCIMEDFGEVAASIAYKTPECVYISGRDGKCVEDGDINAKYWQNHARESVNFTAGLKTLYTSGCRVFVEIGPHPILLALAMNNLTAEEAMEATWLPSIRKNEDEWTTILTSLAKLYVGGVAINWQDFDGPYSREKLELPKYPFQRQKFWFESIMEPETLTCNTKSVHPLVGKNVPLATADLGVNIYQQCLNVENLDYLNDHQVANKIIMPGAGFLEMMLATGHLLTQGFCDSFSDPMNVLIITELAIDAPLEVQTGKNCRVQIIASPIENTKSEQYNISIYRKSGTDESMGGKWKRHACGKFDSSISKSVEIPEHKDIDSIKSRCGGEISTEEMYKKAPEIGIYFGPHFQSIKRFWKGKNEILAELVGPPLSEEKRDYICHPVVLDALIQTFALRIEEEKTSLYLPVGIEKFTWYSRKQTQIIYAHVVWEDNSNQSVGNVVLLNENGVSLATMSGIRLVRTTVAAFVNFLNSQRRELPELYQEIFRPKVGPLMSRVDLNLVPESLQVKQNLEHYSISLNQIVDVAYPKYETLDKICYYYIIKAFYQLGWQPYLGQVLQSGEFLTSHIISSKYEILIDNFFEILTQERILEFQYNTYNECKEWKVKSIPPLVNKVEEELNNLTAMFLSQGGEDNVELPVVKRCGENLAIVLQGKETALGVLFPDETTEISAFQIYTEGDHSKLIAHPLSQKVCQEAFAAVQKGGGSVVRILEVGAGTGSTSEFIFAAFKILNIPFYYTFTDISPTLLTQASQKFKDMSRITYKLLDIENDPKSQGFAPYNYDLIIACNVFHATADLNQTVRNVRHLLAPKGMLVIFEMIKPVRHIDFIFGLLDGYWRFKDYDLRPDHPMITDVQWETLLKQNSFSSTATISSWKDELGIIIANATEDTPTYTTSKPLTLSSTSSTGCWLIFTQETKLATDLQNKFQMDGKIVIMINQGESYCEINDNQYNTNPNKSSDFKTLFSSLSEKNYTIEGIVYLWGIDVNENDLEIITAGLLHLSQTIFSANFRNLPKLFLVSKGMYYIEDQSPKNPVVGVLRGILQVVKSEQPGLKCTCIDLDPDEVDDSLINRELYDELWSIDSENHIALRQRKRFVLRILPIESPPVPLVIPGSERYHLKLPASRSIPDLILTPMAKYDISPDQVEVVVKATGLNFRDLFVIMKPDMFKSLFEEVGMEFSGLVTSVGSNVTKYKRGDEIFGFTSKGAVASHTVVPQTMVMRKPKFITHAEAATMPITFFTAYQCLIQVAKMKPSDTVLIHVASGGVGLAAVQICKEVGSTIIATAGSRRKRTYLRSLGINHIFHSRNTSFGDDIMRVTNGNGVDIVLNSLTGPNFKETSLRILKQNSRFVEMSKINIWQPDEVKKLRSDVEYTIVNLEVELDDGVLSQSVESLIMNGVYKPLPFTCFDVTQTKEAFTYFQKAHHIGKIVVTMPEINYSNGNLQVIETLFNPNSTYLITGGLGGIGLEVAKFMVNSGAMNIILVGRSPPNSRAEDVIRSLSSQGSRVIVLKGDVGNPQECADLFATIKSSDLKLPPLRGIMHAAGVISDGMVMNQNMDKFKTVYNAKVKGAWNLHKLSLECNLEHFILFSSGAALLGTMGQSNHSAANAFLDTFTHFRHALGLPAQTINWGIWSDVGVAADLDLSKDGLLGIKPFSPAQGIAALKAILRYRFTQVAVMDIDSTAFKHDIFSLGSYIEEIISADTSASSAELSAEGEKLWNHIIETPPEERVGVIKTHLESLIRQTLKLPDDEPVDENQKFSELGLDSLMAVEMRNRLQMVFGKHVTLNATALLDHPTIAGLSSYLTNLILSHSNGAETKSDTHKQQNQTKKFSDVEKQEQQEMAEMHKLMKNDFILPQYIQAPTTSFFKKPSEFRNVLLTGATGQLGIYMLNELSQKSSLRIHCLLRAKMPEDGRKRVIQKLKKYQLLLTTNLNNIEFVPGNIALPQMGMNSDKYIELAELVDTVIHCAVKGNHMEKYKKSKSLSKTDIRSVNVGGVLNVLEFASHIRTKHVLHASSIVGVNEMTPDGRISEELPHDNDYGESIKWGYAVSKFVCEKLMKQAIERGIPCKVLRYPLITGHSKTGMHSPESNHQMLFFLACMHIGLAPNIGGSWSSIPADVAAKVSLDIFFNDNSEIGAYNITNPYVTTQEELVKVGAEEGVSIKVVPYSDWVRGITDKGESSFLFPFRDIYANEDNFSAFIRSSPTTTLAFTDNNNIYSLSPKVLVFINSLEKTFPKGEDILRKHMDYSKRSGILAMFGIE